jgi:hypothetical protein
MDRLDTSQWAKAFQVPVVAVLDSAHPGILPKERSVLKVSSPAVEVLALGEDKNGSRWVRLQAQADSPVAVDIEDSGAKHPITLKPWQIATVRLD